MANYPYLGFGLGLRPKHYIDIVQKNPPIDWFEILTEEYLMEGGLDLYYLAQIREKYPVVMHGVSLSIGSADPVDLEYLKKIKKLADTINPVWISDHLCWTGVNKINSHDLLPLPYTEEALQHVTKKVAQVQDFLGRQILLENVSSYVTFRNSEISEWEFLTNIAEQSDCLILLDVNNVYVSAFNHGFNAHRYLDHIPIERVCQFHIAGHSNYKTHIVDTHDHEIINEVWDLYKYALKRFPKGSTLIERDDHIPPLEELMQELSHARTIAKNILEVV